MEIRTDFKELLEIEYLIVGGYALGILSQSSHRACIFIGDGFTKGRGSGRIGCGSPM
jgi:hypothetical protein